MDKLYLLAGANLFLAVLVMASCVCRLGASSALTVRRAVRIKYVAILTGAAASGLSPLAWSEYPGYGQVAITAAVLVSLLVEMRRWRYGAPPDVLIDSDVATLGAPEIDEPR